MVQCWLLGFGGSAWRVRLSPCGSLSLPCCSPKRDRLSLAENTHSWQLLFLGPVSSHRLSAEDSEHLHNGACSFLPSFSIPRGKKVGFKDFCCLITSLNYQLNNTWPLIRRADWWLPLLTLFYFYCLARASSFKSWIIRTETLRYSSQINPWPIDILLYLTNHTTSLFPDNFSINCFSALIRYKVTLWLGLYIPISDKLSWSPNQLRLGF